MRRFGVPVALCSLHVAMAGLISAQTAPAPGPGPTIRATVSEVLLDIVVRDKHGKLVRNLKPEDVAVYEDGVRQQILSFQLAAGHDVQENQPAVSAKQGSPATGQRASMPLPLPLPLPLREANLLCIVFHNLDSRDLPMKKYTLEAVQEFLRSQMQPDTWIGIFALGSRLAPLHAFTTDRGELLQAAAKGFTGVDVSFTRVAEGVLNGTPNLDVVQGVVGANGRSGGAVETLTTGKLNTAAITGADVTTGLATEAQRGDVVGQRRQFGGIEGRHQLDEIRMMVQQLALLPGHKTVLMLSPGLPSTGDPDLFQAVVTRANRENITIYSLDTNGLNENSNVQAGNQALQHVTSLSQDQGKIATQTQTTTTGVVGQIAERMRQDDYLHTAVRMSDSQSSLRALAEGTGGFLIAGTNDFRKPFQRLIEDVGSHYEAAYRPASNKYDGHLRKIEVKLARSDLSVESRTGYFAVPDAGGSASLMPFEMTALMALNSSPLPHSFDFRCSAFQFRPQDGATQFGIAFELPVANLTATPEPEKNKHKLHAAVCALIKDANGQIVDKFSRDSPYEVPDAQLTAIQASPITWTHAVDLPPGRYTLETAMLDREGNRVSTSVVPIESADHKGVGISNVMLAQRIETLNGQADPADPFQFSTNRVVPSLAGTLNSAAQSYVYFVVYPDKTNTQKPKIEVQFSLDGQVLAKQAADLPAPDAAGGIPMVVAAIPKPGNCELRITAMQGSDAASQSVKYSVPAQ